MRFGRKFVFGTVAFSSVAAGVLITTRASTSSEPIKTLTSAEFNALYDQKLALQLLQRCKKQQKGIAPQPSASSSSTTVRVTFYRLLGCPFCAKVKSVLDASRIEYEEVIVDPLRGSGIVDPRYPLVPQLRLEASDAPSAPFVVDSAAIVSAIAVAYGFQKQLTDEKIVKTRSWMTDRFQGVTFAAINSSWTSAFYAYPDLVPPVYGNIIFRVIGATALYGLANWKILPRLKDGANSEVAQQMITTKNIDGWVREEANQFTSQLVKLKRSDALGFHGGERPDLADVEMFGVMRAVSRHPTLGAQVVKANNNELGQWFNRMEEFLIKNPTEPLLK
ncbi:glutaredoxin-like protein, putative [Bodo saltans]|uniref:Glutaredoxin-like protein, putative n=1 Tax=Bodo saltans TaxID=75058 RepID=A0A0S4JV60_BODSA|nr:glutaredoxin-like protein, putative [Bodo saltans]|eukprot:CUG93327.1 glutaredoxin-like protein, putative [Bodo saltans]